MKALARILDRTAKMRVTENYSNRMKRRNLMAREEQKKKPKNVTNQRKVKKTEETCSMSMLGVHTHRIVHFPRDQVELVLMILRRLSSQRN